MTIADYDFEDLTKPYEYYLNLYLIFNFFQSDPNSIQNTLNEIQYQTAI